MGWIELKSYIETQLAAGYDEQRIRNSLLTSGYSLNDIDKAFEQLNTNHVDLSEHVKKYNNQGYSLDEIQESLLNYGYSEKDIKSAIDSVDIKPESAVKFELHISKGALFVIGMLVIVSVFSVLIYFTFFDEPIETKTTEKQLDVTLTVITSSVEADKDLMFKVSLTNFGTFRGYDVLLDYTVTDENDLLIDKMAESKYIESTMSFVKEIKLKDIEPGKYFITVTAKYDNYTSIAKKMFKIVKSLEEVRNESVELDIPEPIIPDDITKPVEEEGMFAGLSRIEINEHLAVLAKEDPETAAIGCSELERDNIKSSCFITLASLTKDYNLCSEVDKDSRDSCYITIAMNSTDAAVCDEISQSQVKNSCKALIDVNINKENLLR